MVTCIEKLILKFSFVVSASVVSKETRYEFLSGTFHLFPILSLLILSFKYLVLQTCHIYLAYADFVPEKVTAEDALAQSKLAERGAG